MKSIRLGLIGFGTVGAGVAHILDNRGDELADRTGIRLEITKVAVRDLNKKRAVAIDPKLMTDDPFEVVTSPDVDIVVEVMGGEDNALALLLKAAHNGKHLVTANKHLLALRGEEVYNAVEQDRVELGFEAAVAGAIPVIRSVREAFAGDRIELIQGIVNGTGNYILSRMTDEGKPFDEILKDAQALGYAEVDPTFDVEGIDSAHKIAILATVGFKTAVEFNDVYTEGITAITPMDIEMAREFGFRIKLLAVAERNAESVDVRVHPAMIPSDSPIANVNGAFNAVELFGESSGINMLVGPGAGGGPTASAIMGDVIDISKKIVHGSAGKSAPMSAPAGTRRKLPVRPIAKVRCEYYLRFTVPDKPGVLARLSGALGESCISISSMIQRGRRENEPVSVVLMTHTALEADMDKALRAIDEMNICAEPTMKIRIARDEKS